MLKKLLLSLVFVIAISAVAIAGNRWSNAFANMSSHDRHIYFSSIIASTGYPCKGVVRSHYSGTSSDNNSFWVAKCSNGKKYMIMIDDSAEGHMTVLDCDVAATVGVHCN